MSEELELTILMPCLNEAETIGTCVRKAVATIKALGVSGEVLVSDNGSTDGSQAIAIQEGARVIPAPERGYGAALIAGINNAYGRFVIMADADDSYDLTAIEPFLVELRKGRDLVMGNRFRGGISPGAMPPLHRYLGNPVLSWLGRALFKMPAVRDFHCGMRGFNRARIKVLGLSMPGMEFASEMVVRAALAEYDMAEVPTTLKPDGRSRPPHLRTWRDGWRHLRFLLMFAPNRTLILPGVVLLLLGLIGVGRLSFGPVQIGSIELDINALVYACMAILVGAQLIMCGGFAQLFGRRAGIIRSSAEPRWLSLLQLEWAAVLGLILIIAGGAGTVYAFSEWTASGFGPLDPRGPIRVVLPSATAVSAGALVLFSGIVGSLLTLVRPILRDPVPTAANEVTPTQPLRVNDLV